MTAVHTDATDTVAIPTILLMIVGTADATTVGLVTATSIGIATTPLGIADDHVGVGTIATITETTVTPQ